MSTAALPDTSLENDLAQELRDKVGRGDLELPVLSQAAAEVVSMCIEGATDARTLADALNHDPSLAGHVLRVANSAAFAPVEPVVSLAQAVSRMGLKTVGQIAFGIAVGSRVFHAPGHEEWVREMWRHAALTGAWAREVARVKRASVESAFVCGLLHDIGEPVLLQAAIDLLSKSSTSATRDELEPILLELHAQAGASLARAWKMAPWIVDSIANHHDDRAASDGPERAILQLADELALCTGSDDEFPERAAACVRNSSTGRTTRAVRRRSQRAVRARSEGAGVRGVHAMTFTTKFDVVVIGGGPGGQKAAVQASKAGRRVVLIDRESAVGGECVRRGTIPSKTLRQCGINYMRWTRDFVNEQAGERCDLAMSTLLRRQSSVMHAHERYMSRQMERNGISIWRGQASFLSPDEIAVKSVDGTVRRVAGEVVVLATGSRPRTPPNVPVDHENILDSDSILSLPYLPKSLIVLGAGVIACEFATVFASLGVRVTIVDKSDRPLAFLDSELTERFTRAFESMGSRFLGRAQFKDVAFDGVSQVELTLDTGEVLHADKLLCALGRTAQVAGLALEKAGLKVSARGTIEVDEHCRTCVPGIYAVGDVIGPPALAATSMEQGRRAVRHALGLPPLSVSSTTPAGIYTIPEMSSVGLTEAEVVARAGGAVIGRAKFGELARGHINGDEGGLLKLICDPRGERVLGAQIIGDGATELIHVAQMAIATEQTIDVFLDNVFNFPTFAEAYLVAALDVLEQRNALKRAAA